MSEIVSQELLSTIDGEIRWRESEMALAKIHLHRSIMDRLSFRYSYRCFVMLTYAHFEAFTKRVIAQAIQDMVNSGVKWSQCQKSIQVNLFANQLRTMLSRCSNDEIAEKASTSSCLIDALPAPDLALIFDCGNMNPSNFDWAVGCVGLNPQRFSFARRDIGRLVSLRHDCAHGEALTLDTTKTERELANDAYVLQNNIIVLMHALAVHVIDHFSLLGYKRAS